MQTILEPPPDKSQPAESFECPVCRKVVLLMGGDENSHVEECLSRQAIRALLRPGGHTGLKQEAGVAKRKPSAARNPPMSPPPSKKQRQVGRNTIDTYFKR
jgi:hypothetical protein